MRLFLKKIFYFFIFSGLVYSLIIFISAAVFSGSPVKNIKYKPGFYGYLNTRAGEVKTSGKVDIVFLGSSHSYRGFDTRIFKKHGFSSFNLGSSSQTPLQTRLLIKRYLKKLNPGLVIMDVYPAVFGNDGVESSIDFISNDFIGLDTVKMAFNINNIIVYNSLLFGFFKDLLGHDKDFKDNPALKHDLYVSGGFVEKDINFSREIKDCYPLKKWEIIKKQKNAFKDITAILKKDKITLVLVRVPVEKNFYSSYSNNKEMDEYFSSSGTYYNFNEIYKDWEKNLFYDRDHLNQNGVLLFNNNLIEILKRDGLLK